MYSRSIFYSLCTDAVYCCYDLVTSRRTIENFFQSLLICYLICEDHGRETMSINFLKVVGNEKGGGSRSKLLLGYGFGPRTVAIDVCLIF